VVCDQPEATDEIVGVLADGAGLALPGDAARAALQGGSGSEQIHFHGAGAAFPALPHAMWFLRQMRRWGWLTGETSIGAAARRVYRPDLFSLAARLEDSFIPADMVRNVPVPETIWESRAVPAF
jgi:nitrate/nitrite transport system substrate-binding protein